MIFALLRFRWLTLDLWDFSFTQARAIFVRSPADRRLQQPQVFLIQLTPKEGSIEKDRILYIEIDKGHSKSLYDL